MDTCAKHTNTMDWSTHTALFHGSISSKHNQYLDVQYNIQSGSKAHIGGASVTDRPVFMEVSQLTRTTSGVAGVGCHQMVVETGSRHTSCMVQDVCNEDTHTHTLEIVDTFVGTDHAESFDGRAHHTDDPHLSVIEVTSPRMEHEQLLLYKLPHNHSCLQHYKVAIIPIG